MKKHFINTAIYLLIAVTSFSQVNRNIISFSIGPSFPIGAYGKTDLTNSNAGLAKTGEHINFSFDHKINTTFAVSVMLYGQRNSINVKSLENQFSNRKFQIFNPNQLVSFPGWKFDKKAWLSAGLLAGGANEFPVRKSNSGLYIKFKGLIGVIYASLPKINGVSSTDLNLASITHPSKSGFGVSYLFSGGVTYNLNKKYYLLFDLQYAGSSQIKFKDITTTFTAILNKNNQVNMMFQQSQTTSDAILSITTLNLNLGIGINL